VARRCVRSRNLENEETKARYRAVENTTTMGCNSRKTNNNKQNYHFFARDMVSSRISSTLSANRDFKEECVKKLKLKRLANNTVNEDSNSFHTFYSIASNYRKTRITWSKTIYNI
jgi:hypothetical protein